MGDFSQGLGLFAAASVILLGASTTLVLVLRRIVGGDLVPEPLVRRTDAERAIAEVKAQADARVADARERADARVQDAQDRAEEYRGRADKAEERESKWRDAWTVSETGRALAEAHVAGLTRAMAPVAQVLTSEAATVGLTSTLEPRG